MKKRSEADSKYTWKLEDMVAEDSQWEQMFKEASGEISEYASYKGRLAESADTLYACLLFDDKLSQKIERLYVYARMRSDEDTTVQRYQDMFSRAQTLSYRAAENSSFLVPEILSMDRELLEQYMAADNGIGHFKRALEIILACSIPSIMWPWDISTGPRRWEGIPCAIAGLPLNIHSQR